MTFPIIGSMVHFHYVKTTWRTRADAQLKFYEHTETVLTPAVVLREPYTRADDHVWVIDVLVFRPGGTVFFEGVVEGEERGCWARMPPGTER